jgi:D-alanine-D-alanine ligase
MNGRERVGVLLGGLSSEREVSLKTGEAVYQALVARGHDAVKVFVDRDVDLQLRSERIDVAFVALHGRYGEDGCVQGLLELRGIPYTGSGPLGSALSLDKLKSKELFRLHNVPTPTYYVHHRGGGSAREQHGAFGYPAVVKPRAQGSSLGVRRVDELDELEAGIDEALRFDDEALVERFHEGREVHVLTLGGCALGAAEVQPSGDVLDFAARSGRGTVAVFCPPRVSPERLRGVNALAERAVRALELDGLAEVDLLISDRGNEQVLEVDAGPALGPGSLVDRVARAVGLPFGELVEAALLRARLHARSRRDPLVPDRREVEEQVAFERRAPAEPH